MGPNDHADDEAETVAGRNGIDGVVWSENLDGPIVLVRFRWDEPEGRDTYKLRCPFCNGEVHYHDAGEHPRTTLGGVSRAKCEESGERYYLKLAWQGKGPEGLFIRNAREELINSGGDAIETPLIPKGIDPRVVHDLVGY